MQEKRAPVFQAEDGSWGHITQTVNPLICTIEYKCHSGFLQKKKQKKATRNVCRQEEPSLYLPMLLATATGLRISELRALKYENIDFLNKCASIEIQLGRTKDADPDKNYHSIFACNLTGDRDV